MTLPLSMKDRAAAEFRGQLVVLGTGTSVGVPMIGCECAVCQSDDPHNKRTRCGVAVGMPEGILLVDTPVELRIQLVRERIGVAHAILYTHEHADHLFGLDDVRLFPFQLGHPVPIYCEEVVEQRIRKSFDYAFADRIHTHQGAAPQLVFRTIGLAPFDVLGGRVVPIRLRHGPNFDVLGFRFGNVAYCTDTNGIPDESWPLLAGLDVLILDALRPRPHATHFGLDEAVAAAQRIGARRTYFTHCSHELDYADTNSRLPAGMELAYDGLRIALS